MIYDEGNELRSYVLRNLRPLLTASERERIAAERDCLKQAFLDWSLERAERRRAGEDEPEWKPPDPSSGYTAFMDDVVARVLRENEMRALINRCPNCDSVLRTPQATLCLWCGRTI